MASLSTQDQVEMSNRQMGMPAQVGTTAEVNRANQAMTEAPQQPPTPPTLPSEPERQESPAVITTDSLREQLKNAEAALQRKMAEREAGQTQKTQPETVAEQTTTTADGEEPDQDLAAINSFKKSANQAIENKKREFARFNTRSSSLLRSQVNSINKQFDVRRDQAEQITNNAIAASNVMGARTGRQRYAPEIQRGIISGQEQALVTTLAEIDALEATALAAAEEAAFSRDYTNFLNEMETVTALETQRETVLANLTKTMQEENEARQEEIERQKNEVAIMELLAVGETDPIRIYQLAGGLVPYEAIVEYTSNLPESATQKFDFISGSKYQQSGYFDPSTGEFTAIGRASNGGVTVGGVTIPTVGITDDIDSLPISSEAKGYIRLYKRGDLTLNDILQRVGGDQKDRKLRNEIVGVISQMEAVVPKIDEAKAANLRKSADTKINVIDNVIAAIEGETKTITTASGYQIELDMPKGLAATAAGRIISQVALGTEAFTAVNTIKNSIAGMVAFDELQQMRDNSPTGGALGQVTERELDLLSRQNGNLSIAQDTESLLETLYTIRRSFARVRMINSPNTTPQEYEAMFPDASPQELEELAARSGIPANLNDPNTALQHAAAAAGAYTEPVTNDPNGYSF